MDASKAKQLKGKIEILSDKEDIKGLDELYKEILISNSVELKEDLAEAYIHITSIYHLDYNCGKTEGESTIFEMLSWIEKAEYLTPKDSLFSQKGHLYETLAGQVNTKKEKENYLNIAIKHYNEWIDLEPNNPKSYCELAEVLLNKNIILENYKSTVFKKILSLFSHALLLDLQTVNPNKDYYYYDIVFTSFIQATYQIAGLPFKDATITHQKFLTKFKQLAINHIKKDSFYYYIWADTLKKIIDQPQLDTIITKEVQNELKEKLTHLKTYTSNDHNKLCVLGHLFHKNAKINKSLINHTIALNYYLVALKIDTNTWTYPVYCTNVLKDMALLYLKDNNIAKAKKAFKEGCLIFSNAEKSIGNDFTLHLYYGEFLYDYAKYIDNFTNPELLKEATQKLLIAKKLGNRFYDSPYIYLAKAALKLGDIDKCNAILKECYTTFSTEYYNYDFRRVKKDMDFDELKKNNIYLNLINESIKK